MTKTNETGRSMVEMLGVLAIIGVLSIGGIAGYTTAMNRYRANEIVDMANKYATVIYSSWQTNKAMNGGTASAGWTPATLCKTGLVAVTDSECKVNGAEITIGTDDLLADNTGVNVHIDFGTHQNVCKAAASSLGLTSTGCAGSTGNALTVKIVQS